MNCVILIPAYKPDPKMIDLLRELSNSEARAILVVDDGSGPEHAPIFAEAAAFPKVTLLKNVINLGKGAALHLGLNYAACHFPDCAGVITADADGQHRPADIMKVAAALEENSSAVVLGSRTFTGTIPLRSRFGNSLTRKLVRMVLGLRIRDTQTGLRGIPLDFIPDVLKIQSRRYEFELEMLILCVQMKRTVAQVPIETVYLDENQSSHFNPVVDSIKIYMVLFRFLAVLMLTSIVEIGVFLWVVALGAPIFASQAVSRPIAAAFNYGAVRKALFFPSRRFAAILPKYALFVLISGLLSYVLVTLLVFCFHFGVGGAKILAELAIFAAGFAVQRDKIFVDRSVFPPARAEKKNEAVTLDAK